MTRAAIVILLLLGACAPTVRPEPAAAPDVVEISRADLAKMYAAVTALREERDEAVRIRDIAVDRAMICGASWSGMKGWQ